MSVIFISVYQWVSHINIWICRHNYSVRLLKFIIEHVTVLPLIKARIIPQYRIVGWARDLYIAFSEVGCGVYILHWRSSWKLQFLNIHWRGRVPILSLSLFSGLSEQSQSHSENCAAYHATESPWHRSCPSYRTSSQHDLNPTICCSLTRAGLIQCRELPVGWHGRDQCNNDLKNQNRSNFETLDHIC